MTKEVRERLDRQLAEIRHLIDEIDDISAKLQRAADLAVENMTRKMEVGDDQYPR